ncbi:hypothetical protein ABMA28_006685 [Loxostege sticticalis]|uniref:Uncharacterized protein n=1 Tax=Loxostege sticticalis TaxID=481309 RepID=A0ABD0TN00_LOXSC
MKFFSAVILLACAAEVFTWDFISKNCCEPHDHERLGRICDDGKPAPMIGCCGIGSCNVMCCNCDDGCRAGPYKAGGFFPAEITPNIGFSSFRTATGAVTAGRVVKEAVLNTGKDAVRIGLAAPKKRD